MSVLKAHRSESKAEFVNTANQIYIQTINFLSRISARYSRLIAYFHNYDDHGRVLRLRRLFYSIYGFSPEHIENFREMEKLRCNTSHIEDLKITQYVDM